MPLYEYRCRACAHEFEALVRPGDAPACRACGSPDLERLLSLFAVDSDTTRTANRESSMPKSRQRHVDKEIGEFEDYKRHRH